MRKKTWIKIGAIIAVTGAVSGNIVDWREIYGWAFSPREHNMQLTVFITDEKGNVVLENQGELNIPINNRSLNKPIGLNGRTNFSDITEKNLGDSIEIGFRANGWVLVGNKNKFKFEGKPIHLKVKKDDNLGLVYGIVKSIDGQTLIKGAKLVMDNGEVIITDSLGRYKKSVSRQFRVKSWDVPYNVTVVKKGFKKGAFYCYPNKMNEIRLENL